MNPAQTKTKIPRTKVPGDCRAGRPAYFKKGLICYYTRNPRSNVRHRSASFDRLRTGAHGKRSRQALQGDRVLSFSFQLLSRI
jgi:hypothetical protein